MGLTKPSGGGGEYPALIFRICATRVGSFGIQFPMTIRPPGRVTRTISLATSNGFDANIAPKMLTTRSKEPLGDSEAPDKSLSALAHARGDARKIAFFPKCLVWIHRSLPMG